MTGPIPGAPESVAYQGRLRTDAPAVLGVEPGEWYDALVERADEYVWLRPPDAIPGDRAGHIRVARSFVELRDQSGRRWFRNGAGLRWAAELKHTSGRDGGVFTGDRWYLGLVADDGTTRVVPGVVLTDLRQLSDDELLELLDASFASLAEAPLPPPRARRSAEHRVWSEARLKPGFAWAYRMLDPDHWYAVDDARSTIYTVMISTHEGHRVIDISHVELRSLLE